MTLDEAREYVRKRLKDGVICPCCGQYAKRYRRKLSSGMVVDLIRLWRKAGTEVTHTPRYINGGNLCKLRYWGLVVPGPRRGMWRVTEEGRAFIHKAKRQPGWVLIYNNTFLGLDDSKWTSVNEALRSPFDYDQLMSGG